MLEKPITLKCPTCSKALEWSDKFPFKPFCTYRCKLIDLGEWANENHSIAGQPSLGTEDDESLS
ncbi:MAG: DNA gyrase inhibitor YacG [Pseudomonadales bacterium]|nr:DNA gyrase inhibitor YacG [Pseudomonadales bacterium]